MKSQNIGYLPTVDHLRGLAAVWIVVYHGYHLIGSWFAHGRAFSKSDWPSTGNPITALVIEGHTAVSLFMVLSGFIFTYGALGREIHYKQFIVNRFLRIYPLYLVLIIVTIAAGASSFSLENLICTLLPLANIKRLDGPFLEMSWAIAVEFQFYLIFPFLFAAISQSAGRCVFALIATAVLLRILMIGLWASPRDIGYWHLTGRIDQFVLGMFAAVLLGRRSLSVRTHKWLLGVSAILVVAVLYSFHLAGGWVNNGQWKFLWPTLEGAVWALFVFSYVGSGEWLPKALSRLTARIGELSFSVYLLHFPVVRAVELRHARLPRWHGDPQYDALLVTALLVLPATLAISMVTYRTIELPFLKRRLKYLS